MAAALVELWLNNSFISFVCDTNMAADLSPNLRLQSFILNIIVNYIKARREFVGNQKYNEGKCRLYTGINTFFCFSLSQGK